MPLCYNVNMASDARKAQWRESRRKARERARAAGCCIVCLRSPAPAGRATCAGCGRRANAAKRRNAVDRAERFGIDLSLLLRNARRSAEERFADAERSFRDARLLGRLARTRPA